MEDIYDEANIEEEGKEIIASGVVGEKDPKYFYYVDSDGNVCKKLRSTKRKAKPKKIINYFDKVDLSVPKLLVNGYVSKKFKTVCKTGPNGGYIWLPPTLIGKSFQVILIPKEDWIVSQIGNM